MLLDLNSIVGLSFSHPPLWKQNWPRIFRILAPPTDYPSPSSHCTVIIAAAAEATFSVKQQERERESSVG